MDTLELDSMLNAQSSKFDSKFNARKGSDFQNMTVYTLTQARMHARALTVIGHAGARR